VRTLLLAALLLAAPPALAKAPSSAAALLEDAATFRAALPSVAANLLIAQRGSATAARLERTEGQLLLTGANGAEFTATGSAADTFALRLLRLALGATPPATAFAELDCRLPATHLGLFLFAHPEESLIVDRVGSLETCWLGLETEIARPREWAVNHAGQLWMVRIATYATNTNGWFPQRLDVVRNGEILLTATVTAVAPTPRDLPPLVAPVANPIALPAPTVPSERTTTPSPLRLPL
jgi:hypothetical protein